MKNKTLYRFFKGYFLYRSNFFTGSLKKIKYEKAEFPWAASGKAISMNRIDGKTKLIFDSQSKKIISAGIVGPNAGDLISEAVIAIQIISIAIIPATITQFYTSKLLGMEKSKMILISRILMAATTIIGILLLAPTFKIVGVSVAFVLARIIEVVFLVLSYHLWIKKPT